MPLLEGGGANRTSAQVQSASRKGVRRTRKPVRSSSTASYGTRSPQPTYRNRSTSQPRRRTSGGGGGGGGGGGSTYRSSGGSSRNSVASAPVRPTPPPPPPPMSIADWLAGDEGYQQALRGGKRTLNDLLSDLTRQRGEATTQFGQTKQDVERNRELQLERLADEFASRGLIHSGIYGQEQGRFQEQFANQLQQLEQQQASLLADLLSQETSFRREQDLAMEAAKQEALRRRAEKYNIQL